MMKEFLTLLVPIVVLLVLAEINMHVDQDSFFGGFMTFLGWVVFGAACFWSVTSVLKNGGGL